MISFRYNILIYYFYVIIWTIKILFVYNFISFKNKFNFIIYLKLLCIKIFINFLNLF